METERKSKETILTTYNLWCQKCNYDFSLELEEKDITKAKGFCPKCGSPAKVMGQAAPIVGGRTLDFLSQLGRENQIASAMALRMATDQKALDNASGVNKEVIVSPPPGERGQPLKIPEKVLESIKSKVVPELNELLEE